MVEVRWWGTLWEVSAYLPFLVCSQRTLFFDCDFVPKLRYNSVPFPWSSCWTMLRQQYLLNTSRAELACFPCELDSWIEMLHFLSVLFSTRVSKIHIHYIFLAEARHIHFHVFRLQLFPFSSKALKTNLLPPSRPDPITMEWQNWIKLGALSVSILVNENVSGESYREEFIHQVSLFWILIALSVVIGLLLCHILFI